MIICGDSGSGVWPWFGYVVLCAIVNQLLYIILGVENTSSEHYVRKDAFALSAHFGLIPRLLQQKTNNKKKSIQIHLKFT